MTGSFTINGLQVRDISDKNCNKLNSKFSLNKTKVIVLRKRGKLKKHGVGICIVKDGDCKRIISLGEKLGSLGEWRRRRVSKRQANKP
jgi:hypothetical protein